MVQFLGRQGLIREFKVRERLRETPRVPGNQVLRLRLSADDPNAVVLEVDPSTYRIHRLMMEDSVSGQSVEFVFTDIRVDQRVDSKLFEFVRPEGVELIRRR